MRKFISRIFRKTHQAILKLNERSSTFSLLKSEFSRETNLGQFSIIYKDYADSNSDQHRRKLSPTWKSENSRSNFKMKFSHKKNIKFPVLHSPNFLPDWDHIIVYVDFVPVLCWYTGQSINELENGPSSYRQKGIYFEWVSRSNNFRL